MLFKYCHVVLFTAFLFSCGGEGEKKNCADFPTQTAAQSYFKSHNAHNLDRDNDGIACEHLPDKEIVGNTFDLTYFIGTYSLVGESCDDSECSIQTMQLEVISATTLLYCVSEDLESDCSYESTLVTNASNNSGYSFEIPNGEIQFGSIENGHIDLNFNNVAYYGQSELHTDFSKSGHYNLNGILLGANDKYSLSSQAGRKISWDKTNRINLSSN